MIGLQRKFLWVFVIAAALLAVSAAALVGLRLSQDAASQSVAIKPVIPPIKEYQDLDLSINDPFGFRIGERIPNLEYVDLEGKSGSFEELSSAAAIVIAVRDTGCPVSSRYAPRLARMEQRYASDGVKFVYVNPGTHESVDGMRAEVNEFGFIGQYIHDAEGRIARALRLRATTEVLVLDSALTLIYRGPVDDQYGIGYTRPEVQHPWLERAIDSVLIQTVPSVRYVENVPGCVLGFDRGDETDEVAQSLMPADGLTYHNRISRILQENCVSCHRSGGIAPFALDSYPQVIGYSQMIKYVLERGIMPPWYANPEVGHWANDRSLSTADRRAVLAWIEHGLTEGDPQLALHPRSYAEGWTIGEPDVILELPEPIIIPAEGVVPYHYVDVKTDFPEDRWVRRMEIRPTAPQVTHHILVLLEGLSANDPELEIHEAIHGYFAAMVPGSVGVDFGDNMAKRLPAGARLQFQLHYTPNGREAIDQTRLGLVFADEPPLHEIETASAVNFRFRIPPGAERHEVVARHVFPSAGELQRLVPHMHVRGVAFRYELLRSDGSETVLLDIPNYNFNWQLAYDFATPVAVEKGDVLRARAWYDNSRNNPYNPDPTATVRWGEQTWEEMLIGYFDWVRTPEGELLSDN